MSFTADQLKAIDTTQIHLNACVTAGPGSGKTTVLVEYFRRLVESGINPQRILAITFTEKAAANMREKLSEAFEDDDAIRAAVERGWVSTVHGFCSRLLRENAVFAAVDPEFYVADEREQWRLQQESIADALSAEFEEHPEAVRALIRGLASRDFDTLALSAYDAMRGAGMSIEEVAAMAPPPDTAPAELAATYAALKADPLSGSNPAQKIHVRSICGDLERILHAGTPLEALAAIEGYSGKATQVKAGTPARELVNGLRDLLNRLRYTNITAHYQREREILFDILRRFDQLYRERKQALGALDFADLEEFAVRLLLENPEIRTQVERQFDHVLMDEFQDTNGQQARLLSLVRRPGNFYAVGDVNQSIYGFRHAEPQVFRDYRRNVEQASHRLVDLADNFRSRADILRAVETIAGHAEGVEPRPLVASRVFAEPRPVAVELMGILGADAESTLANEAGWVARRILELTGDARLRFQDIAVLVRNSEVISEFTAALDEAGIPYVVNRGRGFFEARDVKDLYHLLRVIANPRDEISLAAVLRSPLVYASDESLLVLRLAGNLGESLLRLADRPETLPAEEYEKLIRFRDRLSQWRMRRQSVSFDRLLLQAIDDCGYPARSWTNIEKFLSQARAAAIRMPLDDFVEMVDRFRGDDTREPEAPPEDVTDTVNIMTAHSAKGLEFPVVFVAALHKGTLNQTTTLAFSRNYGLGARWRNPATGEDKNDLFQHAIHEERKQREREEANRLLYVAMTRAEEHLVLSFSGSPTRKPEHWAKAVLSQLPGIAAEAPCDEILTFTSPRGEDWTLRVFVTDQAPERLPLPAIAETEKKVEWLEPPAPAESHDANATVTAIATFAACPRRYYLGQYLGFEGKVAGHAQNGASGATTSAGEFGSLVHDLLAGKSLRHPDPQAAAMAAAFQQSTLGRRAARAFRIEREFDFLMAVEGIVVRGQIDLWFEEGGELVVVDYKTDRVTAVEAHQRAHEYAIQVRLYALALEQIAGRAPDRAWLHFLRPNTLIAVDLTPSLLDSPEHMVRELREAQAKQYFPLREGEHCTRCPFFHGLCASQYKA